MANNSLINITTDAQGGLLVDSVDFATGLDIQHKNLLETIRTHREAIEADFGLIAFETRKVEGKGRPESFVLLTEDQALFVGTLSRNSARVIAFKSVLVRSFAEARRKVNPLPPVASTTTTEQLLVQLVAGQQLLLEQLRVDVTAIQAGQRPASKAPALSAPAVAPHLSLRATVKRKVNAYCERYQAEQTEAYSYLYKRLFEVYGISVYRLMRTGKESLLDAVEKYGHLDRLYSLIEAELVVVDQ